MTCYSSEPLLSERAGNQTSQNYDALIYGDVAAPYINHVYSTPTPTPEPNANSYSNANANADTNYDA